MTQTMLFKVTFGDGDEHYVRLYDVPSINFAFPYAVAQATVAADAVGKEIAGVEFWIAGSDAEHYPYGSAQAEAELLAMEERGYERELRGEWDAPIPDSYANYFSVSYGPDDIPF